MLFVGFGFSEIEEESSRSTEDSKAAYDYSVDDVVLLSVDCDVQDLEDSACDAL